MLNEAKSASGGNTKEILDKFENEVVQGKKPSIREYEKQYGPLDEDTRGLMQMMLLIASAEDQFKLPEGFMEEQEMEAKKFVAQEYLKQAADTFAKGDNKTTRQIMMRVIPIHEKLQKHNWLGFEHFILALIADAEANLDEAIAEYVKSSDYYAKAKDVKNQTAITQNIALAYMEKGDTDKAKAYYREAIKYAESIKWTQALGHACLNLGALEMQDGHYKESYALYNRSLKFAEEAGEKQLMASAYHNLGELASVGGGLKTAEKMYHESLKIAREIKDTNLIAQTAGALGALYASRQRWAEASQCYNEALSAVDTISGASKEPAAVKFRRALGSQGMSSTEEVLADFRRRLDEDKLNTLA